jgi:putative ABC transport system substrate-binding protein
LAIPVVFAAVSDPLRFGLVASLARPGGTMTGISYLGMELNPKRVQLLKEALPEITRVRVLVPGDHPLREQMVVEVEAAARSVGVKLQLLEVTNADPNVKIDQAFETMTREHAQAVLGLQGPHFYRERKRIAELSLRHRLPGIFEHGDYAEAGCLLAYSPNLPDMYRYAATYVDKILRGAKPGDLPVEQPKRFELAINVKTAKALGVTIPPSLLLRTDRVIE